MRYQSPYAGFVAVAAALIAMNAAKADQSGDFTYSDNGSTITITDYPNAATGAVVVPATIVGKPVTAIGASAFIGCTELTSITLPSSVTSIGNQAFGSCTKATSINIPTGVTTIEYGAFLNCRALTSITLPPGVTYIDTQAFQECKALTSFVMPDSVTGCGTAIFYGCDALTKVTLSKNLPAITSFSFYACNALTSMKVPASVSSLDANAFAFSAFTELIFQGNAPATVHAAAFNNAPQTLQLKFYNGRTGFTTPTWQGVTAVNIGDEPFPEIEVKQPATLDLTDGGAKSFGTVTLGAQTLLEFTIKNVGDADLTGLAVTKDGAAADDFLITPPASELLAPDASVTFQVAFKPSAAGTRTAVIQIANDDADENPFDITLSGTGANPTNPTPEIAISSGSELKDGKAKVSFGTAVVGGKTVTKSFIITNKGLGKLTGLSITRDGKHPKDFKVSKLARTSLDTGGSTGFKVTFKPTDKGTRSATIHVKSNDKDENPFDILLGGAGAVK
jgi:BspA type Leucine rich repeat region (6 copies)/Abnormal spindle-like microcephaly-assoc'd, ASPM-SPD-2-Hydin